MGNDIQLMTNALGMIASIISFVMWLPQAASTWKHRNNPLELAGISRGTQYFVLVNATIWGVYGVLAEAYWTGAPGLVNFPLALMTLLLINRGKKMAAKMEVVVLCGCGWGEGGHQFFVTTATEYGTIRDCQGTLEHGFPVPAGALFDKVTSSVILPPQTDFERIA